jgi:hypothetical protein
MRKHWIVFAATLMVISLSTYGAAAQGPQGVGAEEAAHSSHAPHSYNPVNWMKKGPKTAAENPKKSKNKKSSKKPTTTDSAALPPKA